MLSADLYIDTSRKGPSRGNGRYIYILGIPEEGRYRQSAPQMGSREDATEVSLTLDALTDAMRYMNKAFHINVYTDCETFAAAIENGWLDKWRESGWLNTKGRPVADADKWQQYLSLSAPHEVELFVKAPHSYKDWMRWTVKENGDGDNRVKGYV